MCGRHRSVQEEKLADDLRDLTFSSVAVSDMLKALFLLTVAAGEKAAAEPTRRVAIASFMVGRLQSNVDEECDLKGFDNCCCCRHRLPTWRSGWADLDRTHKRQRSPPTFACIRGVCVF